MGKPTRAFAVVVSLCAACGAADNRVDPGDLALRDLLGMSPEVGLQWDGAQRAAARAVVNGGLALPPPPTDGAPLALATGRDRDERVAHTLAVIDRALASDGDDALGLVRVALDPTTMTAAARLAPRAAAQTSGHGTPSAPVELWLASSWDDAPAWAPLPERGLEVLAALAADAGHASGPVVVAPAPRLAVIAAYVIAGDGPPQLMVNPIVLAALEPPVDDGDGAGAGSAVSVVRGAPAGFARAAGGAGGGAVDVPGAVSPGTGGNPYSFYGSVAECAAAQRSRCEACLPSSACAPVTSTADGNGECTALAADGGRGYFLLCANLALSITSVGSCVRDEASACPFTNDAASNLATLEENARFVDDAACAGGLDRCLADIYGAPPQPFPGLDGGTMPPDPPRDTTVACDNSCDDSNANCAPSCGSCEASGPSCNNAFSCDSSCSSSNEQSGCGGNCEACNADDSSGGSTSGGCGGCDSEGGDSGGGGCGGGDSGGGGCGGGDDSGGGGGCGGGDSGGGGGCGGGGDSGGGSCGSCDNGGGGGGSCGSCDSSGGGGGCGGGSGGGGCNGGGGGGGNSCNVARRNPPPGLSLAVAGLWALLPIPAAALLRRRARRKQKPPASDEEVAS